ncbi:hypothetical protein BJX96DRAFT_147669 [Aspergillus floccosus]
MGKKADQHLGIVVQSSIPHVGDGMVMVNDGLVTIGLVMCLLKTYSTGISRKTEMTPRVMSFRTH